MIDDATAWTATLARDRRYDGRFVFAVRSTGIYCRPSCPARRPLRDNVSFFAAGDAARAEGFRPCRRCTPDRDAPASALVRRARAILDRDEPATLGDLAKRLGVSPHHLQRTFKRETGISPKAYADARRAARLKEQLKEGTMVSAATYEAGYGSSSRLYSQSNARLGMTPTTYREGGRGMHIRFTIARTALGRVLVAMTDRGICAVLLGDSAKELESSLKEEFPNATIDLADDAQLSRSVRDVIASVEGHATAADLPLDLRATAFQIRVWEALREIPRGETRTYSEVATAIGQPRAARAVASACASNRLAVVVPCHRVVRGDGGVGGYRWGVKRKEAILAAEKK